VPRHARAKVVDVVVGALTPLVGATMAKASTLGLCSKHGLEGPDLDPQQVEALVLAIEPGLAVFAGRARARAVLATIRRAVAELPEGP
jgi:hypothetical protein